MSVYTLPSSLTQPDVEAYMREALLEAEQAGIAGELPIGAVLVIHGTIVSRGWARHRERQSQLMHAELQALLAGGDLLWTAYQDAVLFTTVEPCPMCLGAAVMADVPHIVFGSHDAAMDSLRTIETIPYIRRHIRSYVGGILEEEIRALIRRFDPELLSYVMNENSPSAGLEAPE